MSNLLVRNATRDALAIDGVIQFYDTIGKSVKNTPQEWMTVEFDIGEFNSDHTTCSNEETGEIVIWIFSRPGVGDAAAISSAEDVLSRFLSNFTLDGCTLFRDVPIDFLDETQGGSATCSIPLSYSLITSKV